MQLSALIWTPIVWILVAGGAASQEVSSQKTSLPPAGAPAVLNVRDCGALGDGKSLDTAAIKKAVKMAADLGGGTVLFPPGVYVTGTFELLSNVTLDLEAGAVIAGSKNLADYRSIFDYGLGRDYGVNYSGESLQVGVIVARDANNISIIGRGAIDGNGDEFFDFSHPHNSPDYDARYTRQGQDFMNPKYGADSGPVETKPEGRPGTMIILINAKNVLLRDVTLRNAPDWTLHLADSEDAVVTGVHIKNNMLLPNITLETSLITGHWWGKAEPIYIATRAGKGVVRDVRFTNITGEAESGIMIDGSPGSIIRDITFDQIRLEIRAPKPSVAQSVGGNFDLRWTATSLANAVFKHDIPAIYCRYIDGFKIQGFTVIWGKDLPSYFSNAIECENFHNLSVTDFDGGQAFGSSANAAIALRHGSNVSIRGSRAAKGTGVLLSLSDVTGERLFVDNDLSQARQAFQPEKALLTLHGNEMPNSK